MQQEGPDRRGYVGAMFDSERRLVLVPLDPERPWVAFRRMRSWMKRSRKGASGSSMGVFSEPPQGHPGAFTRSRDADAAS